MNPMEQVLQHLSGLYLPGAVALWCSTLFGVAALWGYATAFAGDPTGIAFGRRAYRFYALGMVLTSLMLSLLLLRRDFRIEYVFQYSGLDLPMHYQFAAFWAGQKGSFLIWLLWGTLLGLLLMKACGKKSEPAVMGVYTLTLFGLLLILVRENPFVMLNETPADGKGLNPLLQDDWMVIHPPIMFIGYALTAIPFAFAISAMWRRRYDDWAARAFPWALGGFLVLGAAILMGGYWAYKTLGWGGYWGWDPVENASLIPWLLLTALIHGLYLERTRGRFRRMNLVLACLAFLAVLYGTFLTRSGVLADFSVHSFVDLGISGLLTFLMVGFLGISVYLLVTRLRKLPTIPNEDPMLSRGSFMVLGSIAILASALVITFGTSAPLLTRFQENPGQVGPEFYNRVNVPIAILVAALLTAIPFLTWRGEKFSILLRKLTLAFGVAAVITVAAVLLGLESPIHGLVVFLGAAAATANLQKVVSRIRGGGLWSSGGYLTHVGVGIMLLGFLASSAYDHSTKVTLEQGVPQKVDDLTLTFKKMVPRQGREKERMEIEVVRAGGDTYNAYPKMFINDRTRQLMVNPHIRKFMTMDLYISPIEFEPPEAPTRGARVQLARGESRQIEDAQIRFVDFDLSGAGMTPVQRQQIEQGGFLTVGVVLEVTRQGESRRLLPIYQFNQSGQVQILPANLPGPDAQVAVTAIQASDGSVQLDFAGLGEANPGAPARLSIDVTTKPLIKLVWYGLYVVLLGSVFALIFRARQARSLDPAV